MTDKRYRLQRLGRTTRFGCWQHVSFHRTREQLRDAWRLLHGLGGSIYRGVDRVTGEVVEGSP